MKNMDQLVKASLARADTEEKLVEARMSFLSRVAGATAASLQHLCGGQQADILEVLTNLLASFGSQMKVPIEDLQMRLEENYQAQSVLRP